MFHKDGDVIDSRIDRQIVITVISDNRSVFGNTLQIGQFYIGSFTFTIVIKDHITQYNIIICFVFQAYYFKYFRLQRFFLSGFSIVAGGNGNTVVFCQRFCTQIPDAFHLLYLDQSRIG